MTNARRIRRIAARCAIALAVATATRCAPRDPGFLDAAPLPDVYHPDIVPVPTGAPCGLGENGEAVGSCSSNQMCLTTQQGYPNGYCAADCSRTPCPPGSVCLPYSATLHYCVRTCQSDNDCRASEGYACQAPRPGATPACLPNAEPIGHRDSGRACFATDGDASLGPYLAPLPRVSFDGALTLASHGRVPDLLAESDPSLTLDPTSRGGALVGFNGYFIASSNVYFRGGLTRLAGDGSYVSTLQLRDRDFPNVTQVNVAFDRAGTLHAAVWSRNPDRASNPIRYASSLDGGTSFREAVVSGGIAVLTGPWIFSESPWCNNGCVAPALAIGPGTDVSTDNVYVTTTRGLHDGTTELLFAASPAATAPAFATPIAVASLDFDVDHRLNPAVSAIAPGATPGGVIVSWIATNAYSDLAALGDRANRVRMRFSGDGGVTWGNVLDLTRPMDAPVAQGPWIGVGANATHIAYVTGGLTGAWNVVLATSVNASTHWSWRTVNDDEPCATHAFVGMAVDRATGEAHVVWLDNRYGPGEAVYARCPADPSVRCSRNELVSSAPFVLTTTTDPSRWEGTRSAVALAPDGAVWAGWTDSHTGGPGVNVARGHP